MAVAKIDPKVIFASEAPAQDTPAVFTNKTVGWGESRKNGGRPTIKQSNALQQETDLKILWLNENSVTPFDATIDYPENAVTLKDDVFKILKLGVWEVFLDKSSVGLINVDNTSDLNKPVSTATQTALNLKADKSATYTKVEVDNAIDLLRPPYLSSDVVDGNQTQDQINLYGGKKYDMPVGGYPLNARVLLDNGDIVKSNIQNNTNDPNVNMTGWIYASKNNITTVDCFADIVALDKWQGRVVQTKGYYQATNFALSKPYRGGALYVCNAENEKWELSLENETINVYMFGAKGGFVKGATENDDTLAFKDAVRFCEDNNYLELFVPAEKYLITDEIPLHYGNYDYQTWFASRLWNQGGLGVRIVGAGDLATYIVFKPADTDSVCFSMRGGQGASSRRGLSDLSIVPYYSIDDTINTPQKGIAVLEQDCCFSKLNNIYIGEFNKGICLNNFMSDGFTEFNKHNNIRIFRCDIAVDFLISADNNLNVTDSFHGNAFTNTMIQLKNGGIGVRVMRESETGVRAHLYNGTLDIKFFGAPSARAFWLERGFIRGASGAITVEGEVAFYAKNQDDWMQVNGSYNHVAGSDVTVWEAPARNGSQLDSNYSFRFNNLAKPDIFYSGTSGGLSSSDVVRYMSPNEEYHNGSNIYGAGGFGTVFLNRFDDTWGWGFAKQSSMYGSPANADFKYRFAPSGDLYCYNSEFTLKNNTYGLQFSSQFSSFMPQQSGVLSLGIGALYYKDLFVQNAPTVISDVRHKTDVSELTEQELQCAIACGKLYRKYKLNAAVDEKGLNSARYHVGVIAQEVVQCFTDHGLDWRKYGIITYEKWDTIEAVEYQAATYDENDQELTPEIQAIEAREAGEIYMVRYEELNCFINAGLEYRLSKIENM